MISRLSLVCFFQFLAAIGLSSAFLSQSRPTFSRSASSSSLSVAVDTSDIKNGMTIEIDGEPFKVVSFSIMKQARGAAKTTIKFKNLMKGTTIENTYRSGEKFETAMIEKKQAQFTYMEGVRIKIVDIEALEYTICRFLTLLLPTIVDRSISSSWIR